MQLLPTVLCCAAALIALGVVSLGTHGASGRVLAYGGTFLACVVDLTCSLIFLGSATGDETLILPIGLPWLGGHFRLDALSAFFLLLVALAGAASSIYGLGYGRAEPSPRRVLPFFPVFIAAMTLVLLADDAFIYLLSWEFMSLSSWALVMAHHREPGNMRAGFVYLVMASLGTLCLLLAFGVLAGAQGAYAFEQIRAVHVDASVAAIVLVLALVGAGSKAGLVPLHVWLPLAHPAAPSHVSALLSGVMTKIAIYGFVRIVFDLLGAPAWWWGALVMLLGGVSAVLGLLYALMESDLKRLLAYSTVENVGIVFIGLGLALAFQANGFAAAAALALTAAFFHAFNHALFKTLLFCAAGAVLHATGQREMEKLGGLIHKMPVTALLFLIGAAAISALPPLNGFASEWLMFQAILASPTLPQWALKFELPAMGAMLALAAALAATCFVRAFGIAFLGRSRSAAADVAHEVDRLSLGAMIGLAALCVGAGLLPSLVVRLMAPAVAFLNASVTLSDHASASPLVLVPVAEGRSSYNAVGLLAFITAAASIAAFVIHRFASKAVRRARPWACGFPVLTPRMQYTAASFAQPIRRVFGSLAFETSETVDMPRPGETRPARFELTLSDRVWDVLYGPVVGLVNFAANHLNKLQFLTIRKYLSLVFAALIALLVVSTLWR
jgi:hydrogenase-4 component B